MKIDLEELSTLSERSMAWQLIKDEVKRRGYWKNKPRGKADIRHLAGRKYTQEYENHPNSD